jgi:hypothetical protein
MTSQIGVLRKPYLNSKSKAMFCSSEKCCEVFSPTKNGTLRRTVLAKILVSDDFSISTCPDCKNELFISHFNKRTTRKSLR